MDEQQAQNFIFLARPHRWTSKPGLGIAVRVPYQLKGIMTKPKTEPDCEKCCDTGEIMSIITGKTFVCQYCCVHEFDYDEGGMCLNCELDGYEHNADNYDEGDR